MRLIKKNQNRCRYNFLIYKEKKVYDAEMKRIRKILVSVSSKSIRNLSVRFSHVSELTARRQFYEDSSVR